MCKSLFNWCRRKNEKPLPENEHLANNNLEISIETEQNINLINKQNEDIETFKSIIKDLDTKVEFLEQELEKRSKINNFENTDSQLFLSQTLFIAHLETSLQELNAKELNSVSNSDHEQLRAQLLDMQNNYNTLGHYYNFYKNYYDESVSRAQGSTPPADPSSTS